MRKLIVLLVALVAASAMGATGWYSDYIIVSGVQNLGSNGGYLWIGGDPSYGSAFDGFNLGNVPQAGFSVGADMRYWSDTQDRDGGAFYWQLEGATSPNEVIWTQTFLGGNDYQGTSATSTSIGNGASLGQHTLTVWAKSWGTTEVPGDSWLNNGGANYSATFTTVPEPTTLVLIGAGIAGLLAFRRRR